MKRLILTTACTAAGVVGLLSFRTESHPLAGGGPLPSAGAGGSSGTTSTAPNATPTTPAGASPGSSAPTSSSGSPSLSYLGSAVTTRYGVVQVKVTVRGSKITDIAFVQLTAFDRHSQEINSWAAPQLLKESLSAQSAHIDTISGASYTTDGYRESLQAALDRAGVK